MSTLLETLAESPVLADGAVGSYLFEQTGRLSEPRHVYEALNVDDPDVISQLHWSYLQAGARCLLVSLWKVDDRATALLMRRFYENLFPVGGTGEYLRARQVQKIDALREAKRWLRNYKDENGGQPFAHPFYWSAFVLVGHGG